MIVEVDASKSLFIAGEAKITVIDGKCEVFGYPYDKNGSITVEKNRSAPVKPLSENLKIKVELGENGYISYIEGDLIPESWRKLADELVKEEKIVIMAVGRVDVGKTGFLTFLSNKMLLADKKVAIVDADTGQSSVGPPTTIGLGLVDSPLVYLTDSKFIDAYFVGSTTPANVFQRSIIGTYKMIRKAFDIGADVVIVDTTGWVDERGRELKLSKISLIQPDYLILIESEFGDLYHIAKPFLFSKIKIRNITPPPSLRQRNRETRREIRQAIFHEYLAGGDIRDFPITTMNLRYCHIGTGKILTEEKLATINVDIDLSNVYVEYSKDMLLVYEKEANTINDDALEGLKQALEISNVIKLNKEIIENILVALKDSDDTFLGLGIIKDFDPESRTLKIYTKVDPSKVKTIEVGHIKASEEGEEQGHIYPWSI